MPGRRQTHETKPTNSTALAPMPAGLAAHMTPEGLDSTGYLDYDDWASKGPLLAKIGRWSKWAIGDWLIAGEERWPDLYSDALNDLQLEYGTLSTYVWMCRRYPAHTRDLDLSWSVQRIVAGLDGEHRETCLEAARHGGLNGPMTAAEFRPWVKDYCVKNAITLRNGRKQIAASEEPDEESEGEVPENVEPVTLTVPKGHHAAILSPAVWRYVCAMAEQDDRLPEAMVADCIRGEWRKRKAREWHDRQPTSPFKEEVEEDENAEDGEAGASA